MGFFLSAPVVASSSSRLHFGQQDPSTHASWSRDLAVSRYSRKRARDYLNVATLHLKHSDVLSTALDATRRGFHKL